MQQAGPAVVVRRDVTLVDPPDRLVAAPSEQPSSTAKAHQVVRVIDPATVVMMINHKPVTVRLLGVQLAKAGPDDQQTVPAGTGYLKQLIEGKMVLMELGPTVAAKDQDGVPVAYLYRAVDNRFVNEDVIRQGYAVAARDYECKYQQLLTAAEQQAQRSGRGLWSSVVE